MSKTTYKFCGWVHRGGDTCGKIVNRGNATYATTSPLCGIHRQADMAHPIGPRFTEEEYGRIAAAAALAGQSPTSFAKDIILDYIAEHGFGPEDEE